MTRTSGLLLHLTSLPGPYGIGDLGDEALEFGRFLARAGQTWWQVLPLTPTDGIAGHSPYSGLSAFAANPLLVSPKRLHEDGLLGRKTLEEMALPNGRRVDFASVVRAKSAMFEAAFATAEPGLLDNADFGRFLRDNGTWLNDFAFFLAVKKEFGRAPWTRWPQDLAQRENRALAEWGSKLARPILYEKFRQYCFFRQWARLRAELAELGVRMLGDAPIYVTHDSPDVWCNRGLFKLDDQGEPTVVAGVPPDYFSKHGQRWGNPVY
ncbi:MAG: 4-alpha-glucanotransferase, partial [Desulfovibrionaceae bacterium]